MSLTSFIWIICAFIGGVYVGVRVARENVTPVLDQQRRTIADNQNMILDGLRRELANIMIRRDPDNFLRVCREAHAEAIGLRDLKTTKQTSLLGEITSRYPNWTDFDLVMGRDHVLYDDAVSGRSNEEIESHYKVLVRFQALKSALDISWKGVSATRESDLEHLEIYARRIKDTRLKQRIEAAIKDMSIANKDPVERGNNLIYYENDRIQVRHVYSDPWRGNLKGVHFKDSNEFGLYESFVADGGAISERYYRSDPNFQSEIQLDVIYSDDLI